MREVMNALKGTSASDRWVGATMYAPDGGTCSLPTTFSRKTGTQTARAIPRTSW